LHAKCDITHLKRIQAEVYRRQGKYQYDGAERLYERALAINRATFKDDHPEIAENLNGYRPL
jgi:hypothetical protein